MIQSSKQELKPCPFCGGTDVRWMTKWEAAGSPAQWVADRMSGFVVCLGCLIRTDDRRSQALSIAAWNRRAPHPSEGLREALEVSYRTLIADILRPVEDRYVSGKTVSDEQQLRLWANRARELMAPGACWDRTAALSATPAPQAAALSEEEKDNLEWVESCSGASPIGHAAKVLAALVRRLLGDKR